jgi:hypothetical protein
MEKVVIGGPEANPEREGRLVSTRLHLHCGAPLFFGLMKAPSLVSTNGVNYIALAPFEKAEWRWDVPIALRDGCRMVGYFGASRVALNVDGSEC